MSKQEAIETLKRSKQEMITEMAAAGKAGGTGRVAAYATTFNQIEQALATLEAETKQDFGQRMAEARAAKKGA
jgi:hypothetical protein